MTKLIQPGREALGALCRVLIASLGLGGLWGTALAGELITYYHNDVAGSPIAATDAKGYYIWRTSYEPYGQRIQNDVEYTASIDNNRWFTGHVEDVETGTLYMQARHYDPAIGRFMSVDPIRFVESEPHTFTRYAYAANNPYRYTDPDGEFINFIVGGVKAAVENVAIQHLEMALGTREAFSWGELALDTTIGTATSGLSTIKNAARVANIASDLANRADDGRRLVYRGLAKDEDPAKGIFARAPGAGNSELSHVAGKRESQWISTTKSSEIAKEKYGEHGVVEIDLDKVDSVISDVSDGFENGGRMSNWARKSQEVLIKDQIPPEAIRPIE